MKDFCRYPHEDQAVIKLQRRMHTSPTNEMESLTVRFSNHYVPLRSGMVTTFVTQISPQAPPTNRERDEFCKCNLHFRSVTKERGGAPLCLLYERMPVGVSMPS